MWHKTQKWSVAFMPYFWVSHCGKLDLWTDPPRTDQVAFKNACLRAEVVAPRAELAAAVFRKVVPCLHTKKHRS